MSDKQIEVWTAVRPDGDVPIAFSRWSEGFENWLAVDMNNRIECGSTPELALAYWVGEYGCEIIRLTPQVDAQSVDGEWWHLEVKIDEEPCGGGFYGRQADAENEAAHNRAKYPDATVEVVRYVPFPVLAAAQAEADVIAYRIIGTEETGLVSVDYRSALVDADGVASGYRRGGLADVRIVPLGSYEALATAQGEAEQAKRERDDACALAQRAAGIDGGPDLGQRMLDMLARTEAERDRLARDLAELQAVRTREAETLRAVREVWREPGPLEPDEVSGVVLAIGEILGATPDSAPLSPPARDLVLAYAAAQRTIARFREVDPVYFAGPNEDPTCIASCDGEHEGWGGERRFVHAHDCPWSPSTESEPQTGGEGARVAALETQMQEIRDRLAQAKREGTPNANINALWFIEDVANREPQPAQPSAHKVPDLERGWWGIFAVAARWWGDDGDSFNAMETIADMVGVTRGKGDGTDLPPLKPSEAGRKGKP